MSSRNMCLLPRATLHSDSEQHGHGAHKITTDMQHKQASWKSSSNVQQGHAAWTCIHLSQDPCFFSMPSGSRLWNRVSSVVRQREEKARIRDFIIRARRFCFFSCSLFFSLLHSFCFVLASESRKKAGAPASVQQ